MGRYNSWPILTTNYYGRYTCLRVVTGLRVSYELLRPCLLMGSCIGSWHGELALAAAHVTSWDYIIRAALRATHLFFLS